VFKWLRKLRPLLGMDWNPIWFLATG